MIDPNNSFVAHRLAKRVAKPLPDNPSISFDDAPTPEGLLDHLRKHLATGETHYTVRPGIPELRAAIGKEVGKLGGAERESDGVIITHGEGEALYVTLLGLGLSSESRLMILGQCRHSELLALLGVTEIDAGASNAANADASYRELTAEGAVAAATECSGQFEILSLGSLLFSAESRTDSLGNLSHSAILIGNLDSVPGLDHFRLGFVAGPPDLVKRIQTWKQALSICTAGPSQRAALFAIEGRSTS